MLQIINKTVKTLKKRTKSAVSMKRNEIERKKAPIMGLAASQARLLSITSRTFDNELRAQLINNAKMRLTTDSARVSDEYIAALNQTQMMFTNYDTIGNEQYQNLTFNSLTAYSSYNDQYGIVNSSGELLVSQADATNYEKAGNLEKFLELYGLEQDTTYFKENKLNNVGYYDKYGIWQDLGVSMEDMQAIYEGTVDDEGIMHYGYDASLNSAEYASYLELLSDCNTTKEAYKTKVSEQMNAFMNGTLIVDGHWLLAGGKKFEDKYNELFAAYNSGNLDANGAKGYLSYMIEYMKQLGIDLSIDDTAAKRGDMLSYNEILGDIFVDTMKAFSYYSSKNIGDPITEYETTDKTYGYAQIDSSGQMTPITTHTAGNCLYVSREEIGIAVNGSQQIIDGQMMWVYPTPYPPDTTTYNKIDMDEDQYTYEDLYVYTVQDADGNENIVYTTYDSCPEEYKNSLERYVIDENTPGIKAMTQTITAQEIINSVLNMYDYFKNNAFANLDEAIFRNKDNSTKEAYNNYLQAAQNLAVFIYGSDGLNIPATYYDYLDDPSWVLSQNYMNPTIETIYNEGTAEEYSVVSGDIDRTHYHPIEYNYPTTTPPATPVDFNVIGESAPVTYPVNYQVVKDTFLIDCMLDQYGEPNYTWIDKNNPDENAEAKVQWYTNLYERMSEGYKVLTEALKGSQEWLQFALESGLVHMEQVNTTNNWVSTMYSNCSNIKESTADVDVTVAEAIYTREMNKIQAKDKQYDMELKNIDTEHSSLEKEYESIKSVIKKNVERNYKMFQA